MTRVAFLVVCLIVATSGVRAGTILSTWTGGSGSSWDTALNWNPAVIPANTPDDDFEVTIPHNVSVDLGLGKTVNQVTLNPGGFISGSKILGTSLLEVLDQLSLTIAEFEGAGDVNAGSVSVTGAWTLDGFNSVVSGGGDIGETSGFAAADVDVTTGGSLQLGGLTSLRGSSRIRGDSTGMLTVTGQLLRTQANSINEPASIFGIGLLVEGGSLAVNEGVLQANGTTSTFQNATLSASDDATLQLLGTGTFQSTDFNVQTGGQIEILGPFEVVDQITSSGDGSPNSRVAVLSGGRVQGGTLTGDANTPFQIRGGALGGNAQTTSVDGALTFSTGTLGGTLGVTNNGADFVFSRDEATGTALIDGLLTNQNRVRHGASNVFLNELAAIVNAGGAIYEIIAEAGGSGLLPSGSSSGLRTFTNKGTVESHADFIIGNASAAQNVQFINDAGSVLDIQDGELTMAAETTYQDSTIRITKSPGGTGRLIQTGPATFAGVNEIEIAGAADLSLWELTPAHGRVTIRADGLLTQEAQGQIFVPDQSTLDLLLLDDTTHLINVSGVGVALGAGSSLNWSGNVKLQSGELACAPETNGSHGGGPPASSHCDAAIIYQDVPGDETDAFEIIPGGAKKLGMEVTFENSDEMNLLDVFLLKAGATLQNNAGGVINVMHSEALQADIGAEGSAQMVNRGVMMFRGHATHNVNVNVTAENGAAFLTDQDITQLVIRTMNQIDANIRMGPRNLTSRIGLAIVDNAVIDFEGNSEAHFETNTEGNSHQIGNLATTGIGAVRIKGSADVCPGASGPGLQCTLEGGATAPISWEPIDANQLLKLNGAELKGQVGWTDGTIESTGGTTVTGTLTLSTPSAKQLNGPLTNAGVFSARGGDITLGVNPDSGEPGQIDNQGEFEFRRATTVRNDANNPAGEFVNAAGAILKVNPDNPFENVEIESPLENFGAVVVQDEAFMARNLRQYNATAESINAGVYTVKDAAKFELKPGEKVSRLTGTAQVEVEGSGEFPWGDNLTTEDDSQIKFTANAAPLFDSLNIADRSEVLVEDSTLTINGNIIIAGSTEVFGTSPGGDGGRLQIGGNVEFIIGGSLILDGENGPASGGIGGFLAVVPIDDSSLEIHRASLDVSGPTHFGPASQGGSFTFNVDNSEFEGQGGFRMDGGTLTGDNGTITVPSPNKIEIGAVDINFSPTLFTFDADVDFSPETNAYLGLEGAIPGDEYDQIVITRSAELAGTLHVDYLNGFEPAVGDVFTVVTYGQLLDVFDAINLPPVTAPATHWIINYGATALTLQISDIPGDYTGDNAVRGSDILKWQRGVTQNPLSLAELADWEMNYGAVGGGAGAVPEPSAWLLLVQSTLSRFRRRRVSDA